MKARALRGIVPIVLVALAAGVLGLRLARPEPVSADALALLVPDEADLGDPLVTAWLDAGSEEGLHVVAMRDADFLRARVRGTKLEGVILPDTIHRHASDELVGSLTRYVEQGGALLLVGDAGVLLPDGTYARPRSRLSGLAGVDYCFHDELADKAVAWGQVWGDQEVLAELRIPPGAAVPRSDSSADSSPPAVPAPAAGTTLALARYGEGTLQYPTFVTRGTQEGRVLLRSPSGVAAGVHAAGKGRVLRVNLPLGYLKGRTDGILLHAFLRYFATGLLPLPTLTAVPDGVGGMVLNWHLDSNAALKPLEAMRKAGLFDQGPYSIHLTAGPDARAPGDGLGLNVDGDPAIRRWIRYFADRGNAIGSHGGWIHDYFGLRVGEDNQRDFEKYLVLNALALERVVGHPIREYSAPVGNQPQWVTRWLQRHGMPAYYFTGNAGMAPTQTYREGRKADVEGWSFPISHLGREASFEEFSRDEVSDAQVLQWLDDLADFCAEHHAARLFYSHPPGVMPYLGLLQEWMARTAALAAKGVFRWYTMTELRDFLDRRKQVSWRLVVEAPGRHALVAQAPRDLARMAWTLPASSYLEPKIVAGKAVVRRSGDDWLIIVRGGRRLKAELPLVGGEVRAPGGSRP